MSNFATLGMVCAVTIPLLSGCLSSESTGGPSATERMPAPENILQADGRFSWNVSGEPGDMALYWFESQCPRNSVGLNWTLSLDATGASGSHWIFGPSPVLEGMNPLPTLRSRFETFSNESRHEEAFVHIETGEGKRRGVILAVGSTSAWQSSGWLEILEQDCNWTVKSITARDATLTRMTLEPVTADGQLAWGFEHEIERAGWTHVQFPAGPETGSEDRRFELQLPNGFAWADQSRWENGGVSGAPGTYGGSMINTAGTVQGRFIRIQDDNPATLVGAPPLVEIFHAAAIDAPKVLAEIGYCRAQAECRVFPLPSS